MKWIITGVAGFIGSNTAARVLAGGDEVIGLDNLSRAGAELNLEWLRTLSDSSFEFVQDDVRDAAAVEQLVRKHSDAAVMLHLAGQVAVTTSVERPRDDFEANAIGTFNVCEAVRLAAPDALLLYASTNKVYGGELGALELQNGRWASVDHPVGISEEQPIDLHSPYACSKGTGDLYVHDYARIFGLKTVSLRQSCIYGPRQFGIEDQGWVAWLTIAALTKTVFTIFGDGRQVRDILYVDDLVDLYVACANAPEAVSGHALNIGGGPANILSLLELVQWLERRLGRSLEYVYDDGRPGDQKYFVSDIRRTHEVIGWEPKVSVEAGLERLAGWLEEHLKEVSGIVHASRSHALTARAG
jgi:CDP-paratose 2-epimerase